MNINNENFINFFDQKGIRNSATVENVDLIKMPKIAKNSQEGFRNSDILETVGVTKNSKIEINFYHTNVLKGIRISDTFLIIFRNFRHFYQISVFKGIRISDPFLIIFRNFMHFY